MPAVKSLSTSLLACCSGTPTLGPVVPVLLMNEGVVVYESRKREDFAGVLVFTFVCARVCVCVCVCVCGWLRQLMCVSVRRCVFEPGVQM